MKSQKQLLPYILTFIMVCLMVGVSQWLNEPEIIFPEITALTTEKEVQDFLKIFDQCYKECFENGKI